uniref:Major facilitator superfamily (MFS) profile domain-containing protein n=2 Tax=Araucaria cunninghamii TaxID=56994 RepID=A0A0D6R0H1_ARACU
MGQITDQTCMLQSIVDEVRSRRECNMHNLSTSDAEACCLGVICNGENAVEYDNSEKTVDGPSDKPLHRRSIFCYGIGHMLNDLTSACWFTYLLMFLTEIGLTPRDAATVMLSGQIADAVTTVFVGELIDRFGHFKMWHGGGSVLVAISFSSVFGGCLVCRILGTDSLTVSTIGYSVFAAIFNVGWAATQVSHMAMVNCITANATSRVALTSCRNAFTMVANLALFAIAFSVFKFISGNDSFGIETQYRWIAIVSIIIGSCFVIIFLLGVREPRLQHHELPKTHQRISWFYWFKKVLYYQVALVYLLARLITNVSQALLAFYLIDDLQMAQSSKAVVPAIIYICSFMASIILQELQWTSYRLKAFFTAGAVLWMFSGSILYILPSNMWSYIYFLSVVIGVGNALVMVTAISMESILVGEDLSRCAFVYGSLSFLEKLSCGIVLYVIEDFHTSASTCAESQGLGVCHSLTRTSLALVPGGCALLGVIVTFTMDLNAANVRSSLHEPLLV